MRTLLLLTLLALLSGGCERPVERVELHEAFFAYSDARRAYTAKTGLEEHLDEVLGELGWSYHELRSALEFKRDNDPEGYQALYDYYRARRGQPGETR